MTYPHLPRLRWVAPANWITKESVTLAGPDGSANVIFSSEPVDPGVSTRVYADAQLESLEEFPGFHQREERMGELRGVGPAVVRTFSWRPEGSDPVVQIQKYATAEGVGYTATATAREESFDALSGILDAAIESLGVE